MRRDFEQAKKYFSQAIAVDPTYPRAYYGLGLIAYARGDTADAESRFLDAVRLDSMPEAIYMLGILYFDTNKYDEAETWFNKYLEKEPAGDWADKAKDMLALIKQKKEGGK
jgi:tetratricopeptide (TPR) repeat protein